MVALEEELRIGSVDDPEFSLTRVGDVAVYGDSLLLALQSLDHCVRLFDLSGNAIGRIGREGSGPGEFRRPGGVEVVGDTIIVRDGGSNSLVLLSIDGEELARVSFPSVVVDEGAGVIRGPSGLFPDGTYAGVVTAYMPRAFQPGESVHFPILRMTESGEILDTLSVSSLAIRNVIEAPEIGLPFIVLPVRDGPLTAGSYQAGRVVVLDPFPSQHPGFFRVTSVHYLGDTIFSSLYGFTPRVIRGALKDALIREALPRERDSDRVRALIAEGLESYPYLSPTSALSVDEDGRIWVGREEVPGEPVWWDVLDSSGVGLFRVALPPDSRFGWASGNVLWTVELDSLDVPFVVRYRIQIPE